MSSTPAADPASLEPSRRSVAYAIEVDNLSFAYPDGARVLKGVSFSVDEGESVAVIGANGAGKSTLLLHLNGVLTGQGSVKIFGTAITKHTLREIRARVGLVFQDPEDQLFLPSVAQDVAFGPTNMGLERAEIARRVEESLAAVGMEGFDRRAPHLLSFGEKKRIATATVLAMRPEILVLDEPSSNLDPRGRRQLLAILAALPVTKVVVTHDLLAAHQLCERALVLSSGRIAADGAIDEILGDGALLEANGLELPYPVPLLPRRRGPAGRRPS